MESLFLIWEKWLDGLGALVRIKVWLVWTMRHQFAKFAVEVEITVPSHCTERNLHESSSSLLKAIYTSNSLYFVTNSRSDVQHGYAPFNRNSSPAPIYLQLEPISKHW